MHAGCWLDRRASCLKNQASRSCLYTDGENPAQKMAGLTHLWLTHGKKIAMGKKEAFTLVRLSLLLKKVNNSISVCLLARNQWIILMIGLELNTSCLHIFSVTPKKALVTFGRVCFFCVHARSEVRGGGKWGIRQSERWGDHTSKTFIQRWSSLARLHLLCMYARQNPN